MLPIVLYAEEEGRILPIVLHAEGGGEDATYYILCWERGDATYYTLC